ncbi:hypothetical protein V8E54_004344 [Elaphomyces granulatus]
MVTGLVFTLLIAVSSGQRQIWRYPVTKKPRPGCDTDAGQIIPGEEPDSVSFSFLLHRTLRDKSSVIIYGPYQSGLSQPFCTRNLSKFIETVMMRDTNVDVSILQAI